jgi:putative glutamine amidotransferase
MTPLIGITTYQELATWRGWTRHASLVPRDFLDGVAAGGGVPLLLPPYGSADDAAAVMASLHGLLLVGGADVDPSRYGAAPDERIGATQPERDEWELALLDAALATDKAVFGVCRGMQLLNIARGGSLRQHLPSLVGHDGHQPAEPVFGMTEMKCDPAYLPGSVMGESAQVPCYHHQSVDALGTGVVATAWSDDGTIEAIVVEDRAFAVGVEWHPEVHADRPLFREFVAAAGSAAARLA